MVKRQVLRNRLVCAVLLIGIVCPVAIGGSLDLTGQWHLVGDEPDWPHMHWEADLFITQIGGADNRHSLWGSFYWEGTDGDLPGIIWGWEDFGDGVFGTESYFDEDTMRFRVEGHKLRDFGSTVPSGYRLGLAIYDADVSADGDHLLNGDWGVLGTHPGVWEAVRVPEPCTLALLVASSLAAIRCRRRHAAVHRRNSLV